jgi:prefoldin alpha subunit
LQQHVVPAAMQAPQRQQQSARSEGEDRDGAFLANALSVYTTEVHRAIRTHEEQLQQLTGAAEGLQATLATLQRLPTKLRHDVMVPLGRHAFMPGHLTRTNEVMVHLGDQYYAEVTAAAAAGIVSRKAALVAEGIAKAQQQLAALRGRLDVSAASLDGGEGSGSGAGDAGKAQEIRSSLAESDALLASAAPRRRHHKAAAADAAAGPQQQQERVRSASGYSYTRPAAGQQLDTQQQQRSAQAAAEDAALQARLAELLLAEEQQEQQQQQQAGLATIQEGDEGDEQQQQLDAVQRLQALEEASDSDDDDESSSSGESEVVEVPVRQQQPQQPAAPPVQQQLKSALKKGFLSLAPTSKGGSGSSGSGRSRGSSSSTAASKPSSSSTPANKPPAFTGTVVEHAAPAAVAGDIVERGAGDDGGGGAAAAAPAAAAGAAAAAAKPVSKFKLRRMGGS